MRVRTFGDVGVPVGTCFPDRASLSAAGVHRPLQAGISGAGHEGADSLVVSGGYEDDLDEGNVIVYTGHGGQDPHQRTQIADQIFARGNLALTVNLREGLPVRVVRGAGGDPAWSPARGYRYDGLYAVEEVFRERGKSGFFVCRFRLRTLPEEVALVPSRRRVTGLSLPTGAAAPSTRITRQQRVVRSTTVVDWVKALHDYACQVCGVRLVGPTGPYAEGAHIRGLGSPHCGPDEVGNVLCLCPNHHVLFDLGAFTLADDLGLEGMSGHLRTHPDHQLDLAHIHYHRAHCARTGTP